ncbi:hypothetical protein ABBQ38_001987 [Trebouxia sp. C0009 RCD-2024]
MLPSDLAGSSQLTRGFCLALSRTHVPHGRQFLQSLTSMHRPLEAVDRCCWKETMLQATRGVIHKF